MTNPEVYPITADFEAKVKEEYEKALKPFTPMMAAKIERMKKMTDFMAETLGEYEHGTADVEECMDEELRTFVAANFNVGDTVSDKMENCFQFLRKVSLKTMSNMYFDLFLGMLSTAELERDGLA